MGYYRALQASIAFCLMFFVELFIGSEGALYWDLCLGRMAFLLVSVYGEYEGLRNNRIILANGPSSYITMFELGLNWLGLDEGPGA